MSQPDWNKDLCLKLEALVDGYVVNGARQQDVFNAIIEQVGKLRAALELDPDPADDHSIAGEPTNEWPSTDRS